MKRIDIAAASTTTPDWPRHSHGIAPATVGDHVERAARLGDNSWPDVRSAEELADLLFRIAHPVVVAFEDRDCTHCRAQRAMLSLAWHQLAWQVSTLRVDGRRLPHLADRYRILGYPTLLVFTAGHVVDRLPGRRDAGSIIDRLSRLTGPIGARENSGAPAGLRPSEATTDASKFAK